MTDRDESYRYGTAAEFSAELGAINADPTYERCIACGADLIHGVVVGMHSQGCPIEKLQQQVTQLETALAEAQRTIARYVSAGFVLPDHTCESCDIHEKGHAYDYPNAQG
jgi:hypothetical protein